MGLGKCILVIIVKLKLDPTRQYKTLKEKLGKLIFPYNLWKKLYLTVEVFWTVRISDVKGCEICANKRLGKLSLDL